MQLSARGVMLERLEKVRQLVPFSSSRDSGDLLREQDDVNVRTVRVVFDARAVRRPTRLEGSNRAGETADDGFSGSELGSHWRPTFCCSKGARRTSALVQQHDPSD